MLKRLWELTRLFFRLGAVTFGGPPVYIAAMQREAVEQRGWLTREHFFNLLGVTYLLPGPNAVEMANHVGYQRAGVAGCIVAGTAFTLPAVLISLALAFCYVQFGDSGRRPEIQPYLLGIKPVVVGIIFAATWRLARSGLRSWQAGLIAAAVVAASLLGCDQILTFLAASVLGAVLLRLATRPKQANPPPAKTAAALAAVGALGAGRSVWAWSAQAMATGGTAAATVAIPAVAAAAATAPVAVPLWQLGLFFLKVGGVLYGSGYVLAAYLQGGLVNDSHWLTQQQLVDAVAIGQITPGPLLSTVTFVGYLLCGLPGAIVGSVAVMLPSFVLVLASNPLVPRLRRWRWTAFFLDAVTAATLGLTAAVAIALSSSASGDWPSRLLAVAAAGVTLRWNPSPVWLILAGAAIGRLL